MQKKKQVKFISSPVFFQCLIFETCSHLQPHWPWTHNPSTSTSPVAGFTGMHHAWMDSILDSFITLTLMFNIKCMPISILKYLFTQLMSLLFIWVSFLIQIILIFSLYYSNVFFLVLWPVFLHSSPSFLFLSKIKYDHLLPKNLLSSSLPTASKVMTNSLNSFQHGPWPP